MVRINPEQMKHHYRGYSEHMNEDLFWTAPNLERRTIMCCFERSEPGSGEANWMRLLQNCKVRAVIPWEQLIDNRRAVFVDVDSNHQGNVRLAVYRAHLASRSGVAFPSVELVEAVQQSLQDAPLYQFYSVIIGAVPDQWSGVYIVYYEDEHPIYVGQTVLLSQRMAGHRRSQKKADESAGFIHYARHHLSSSHGWSVRLLSYEHCTSLAVQGQLTPDLMNDGEARRLLTKRYFQDPGWGLAQAEAALIASLRPHFNQERNTYRRPLQETDYCQQYCRLCLNTRKK